MVRDEKEGLYRIRNDMVEHFGPADGLSGHQVAAIYEDHEKNLWVTPEGGMDMFRNTPVMSYSIKEGLSSSYPTAILASRGSLISVGITTELMSFATVISRICRAGAAATKLTVCTKITTARLVFVRQ